MGTLLCLGVELRGHCAYIVLSFIGLAPAGFLSSSCPTFSPTLSSVSLFILFWQAHNGMSLALGFILMLLNEIVYGFITYSNVLSIDHKIKSSMYLLILS